MAMTWRCEGVGAGCPDGELSCALLETVTNGAGGKTSLEYMDAFETPNTSFHAPVVKAIRTFDGLPDRVPLTESYRYAKGMVDGKGGDQGIRDGGGDAPG